METEQKISLNADVIKYIAIIAMLIDHIAGAFVEFHSVPGQIMHVFGRITAPIMSFFIAEGFYHTKNIKRYVLRLAIFALISWFPFVYMVTSKLPIMIEDGRIFFNPKQSMIFTLLLALLSLIIVHNEKLPSIVRTILITFLIIISFIGDWFCFPLIWALIFDKYRNDYKKRTIAFIVSSIIMIMFMYGLILERNLIDYLYQFGVFLALPLLYFYNGRKSGNSKFNKWFFYGFYPIHIIVLGLLKQL